MQKEKKIKYSKVDLLVAFSNIFLNKAIKYHYYNGFIFTYSIIHVLIIM